MKFYRIQKSMDEIEINEERFINYLKDNYPDDEDIQTFNSIQELEQKWGIGEFEAEIEEYINLDLFSTHIKTIDSDIYYRYDYDDAYEILEWGIH